MRAQAKQEEVKVARQEEIHKWIAEHERDMICCPNQPGLC